MQATYASSCLGLVFVVQICMGEAAVTRQCLKEMNGAALSACLEKWVGWVE